MAFTKQPTSSYRAFSEPISDSTTINIPANSPLDVLKSTERLYIRDGRCPKDSFFPHPTDFEIVDESGKILYHVEYILGQIWTRYGPSGYIESVHMVDKYKREVMRGGINSLVWCKTGYDIKTCANERNYTFYHRYFSNCYDLCERDAGQSNGHNSFTISSNTNTCAFACCCSFCATKFNVYRNNDANKIDVLSEMHIKWSDNPQTFGVTFPRTMIVEEKAVLLFASLLINTRHFTRSKWCCGQNCGGLRLGMWGCTNLGFCGILWSISLFTICLCLVLIYTLSL